MIGAFVTIAFTNPHDAQEALRSHVEWDILLFFAGLFVLVEVWASMGLLRLIGNTLAGLIEDQPEEKQLSVAITLLIWASAITSAFLDNIGKLLQDSRSRHADVNLTHFWFPLLQRTLQP